VPDDLADGESIVDRRRRETAESASILGVARTVWLGFKDSGMTGWPQNADPETFWQADLDVAGERLAVVLREEDADVVVVYDWHGGYGHPDHVQVHRVGHRGAELAGTPRLFEATYNRDAMSRMREAAPERPESEYDPNGPADDGNPFGTPEAEINLAVDVAAHLDQKRRALAAHASQVTDIGMMLSMPPPAFEVFFGTEWFIEPGVPPDLHPGWLLDDI
jgi:LmbE family N-acetylglucosaminyl deacetylase